MRISLIDMDSKMPNLALMKIAGYHRSMGNEVEIDHPDPDRVYISCIFHENAGKARGLRTMYDCPVYLGGPGIGRGGLPDEIERSFPDYELYGIDYSMGFTQRGCIRNCDFCYVPRLEGRFREHKWFTDFWDPDHDKMILLDNNFLASKLWREKLEWLSDQGLKVNFNQGLDIRLITEEKAKLLKEVRYYNHNFNDRYLQFAFDHISEEQAVREGIETLLDAGIAPRHLMVYVLCGFDSTFQEDVRRYRILWEEYKVLPYIMLYNKHDIAHPRVLRQFQRWVNWRTHKNNLFTDYIHLSGPDARWVRDEIGEI